MDCDECVIGNALNGKQKFGREVSGALCRGATAPDCVAGTAFGLAKIVVESG